MSQFFCAFGAGAFTILAIWAFLSYYIEGRKQAGTWPY